MNIPVIETKRMILRPLKITDAQNIFERWTSDERVARYMRWSTHQSVEETKMWLEMEKKNALSERGYQWGFTLKEENYLFGGGGLTFDESEGVFELGYNIMHPYWNQGYTTEAARSILKFAKEKLGQKEVVAWHVVENPASGAVMKKCGFEFERMDTCSKFDGSKMFDVKFYRLKL